MEVNISSIKMKLYGLNGLEKTDLQVIQDTGWIDLNAYVKYRKVNGIVYIISDGNNINYGAGYNTIGTLPNGFIPNFKIFFPFTSYPKPDNGNGVYIEINGLLSIYQPAAATINCAFVVSYPV